MPEGRWWWACRCNSSSNLSASTLSCERCGGGGEDGVFCGRGVSRVERVEKIEGVEKEVRVT